MLSYILQDAAEQSKATPDQALTNAPSGYPSAQHLPEPLQLPK